MYFGIVTKVCTEQGIPSGYLNVKSFEDGRSVGRGKAFFYVRDGQLFVPGQKWPEFSGKCGELRMPRKGDSFMFEGFEIHSGFFVAKRYGFYRQWRHVRDQLKVRKKIVRVGFEKLVTASVK